MTATTLRSELINKRVKNKIHFEPDDKRLDNDALFKLLLEILQKDEEG